MKTCKNCIYSRKIIPRNTNCPSEFVCSLSDEDFHDCISNDMWHFSSKVLDQALEDDAKQASIPYSYQMPKDYIKNKLNYTNVENDLNMREAYEAGYEKAKKEYARPQGEWIYGEDDCGQDGWFCSKCGFFVPWYYRYYEKDINFIRDYKACPHCMSEMITYTNKDRSMRGNTE